MVKKKNSRSDPNQNASNGSFPVVGIGASAGGVQALEDFCAGISEDLGMTFVVVQHLKADHKSVMASLLGRKTHIKVLDINDGMTIEPNHIYVKPPGKDLRIREGALHLDKEERKNGAHYPIDTLFHSLADAFHENAIGVILSGTGSDGTLGALHIKESGGIVLVQSPEEAKFPQMPESAAHAGATDFVLPAAKMADKLSDLRRITGRPEPLEAKSDGTEQNIRHILAMVHRHSGHDFSQYKRRTLERRIGRRMSLHGFLDLNEYVLYLRRNASERGQLFKDFTVNVTRLFRDAEAFKVLMEKGLRPIINRKADDEPLRIWVPGCASGEEAYTMAILLKEALDNGTSGPHFDFKIFASDIDPDAIETARHGLFTPSQVADMDKMRLKRFFTQTENRFAARSSLREAIVFALQNVTRDPPFSNMDLITCRNLLIYLNTDLQRRVLGFFHYSLKPGGILFLGQSETTSTAEGYFESLDKTYRIYRRRDLDRSEMPSFQMSPHKTPLRRGHNAASNGKTDPARSPSVRQARKLVEQTLLKTYTSPAVLIDHAFKIRYFHGDTGRFLSMPKGAPDFNILNMADGELQARLHRAIEDVKTRGETVQVADIQVRRNDHVRTLNLSLKPLATETHAPHILVEFQEQPSPEDAPDDPNPHADDPDLEKAKEELRATRQDLQATIEELQTANEELKSSNEELQANNEELESAKEELQSMNEELETVNAQQSRKNETLGRAQEDLRNLFAASEIGTLFLDTELNIRRFNPQAAKLFSLKQERDVGRSIEDITSKLAYENLSRDVGEVLDTLIQKEIDAETRDGKSRFVMRIVPYRSEQNVIEGVIITFLDVTRFEKVRSDLKEARAFLRHVLQALWEPVLILNDDMTVFAANRSFYETFATRPHKTEGVLLFELGDHQWNIPELKRSLATILPEKKTLASLVVEHDFPGIGRRRMAVKAQRIEPGENAPAMIMVGFDDLTDLSKA